MKTKMKHAIGWLMLFSPLLVAAAFPVKFGYFIGLGAVLIITGVLIFFATLLILSK